MRDGGEFKLVPEGISLHPKQAESLGLVEGATSWGIWTEGRRGRSRVRLPKQGATHFNPTDQGPHLVLSPIYPDVWPASFSLELRLTRDPEALPSMLSALENIGINVLFTDSVIGGYRLFIFNAICEVPELTAWVATRLESLEERLAAFPNPSSDEAQTGFLAARLDVFAEIGRAVLASVATIHARLMLADAERCEHRNGEEWKPFLHPVTRQLASLPWFADSDDIEDVDRMSGYAQQFDLMPRGDDGDTYESFPDLFRRYLHSLTRWSVPDQKRMGIKLPQSAEAIDAARRLREPDVNASELLRLMWQDHAHGAVRVRAFTTLGHARVWKYRQMKPIELTYDATSSVLVSREKYLIHEGLSTLGGADRKELDAPPTILGAFNRSEKSLRLRFLRDWFAREWAFELALDYTIRTNPGAQAPIPRRQLLEEICKELWNQELLVERVANAVLKSDPLERRGRIRLIVMPQPYRGEDDRESIDARKLKNDVLARIRTLAGPDMLIVKDEDCTVVPLAEVARAD